MEEEGKGHIPRRGRPTTEKAQKLTHVAGHDVKVDVVEGVHASLHLPTAHVQFLSAGHRLLQGTCNTHVAGHREELGRLPQHLSHGLQASDLWDRE